MSNRIDSSDPARGVSATLPQHEDEAAGGAARQPRAPEGRDFAATLRGETAATAGPPASPAASEVPAPVRGLVHELESGERYLDRMMHSALGGRDFSPEQLLTLQARVYRYTQQLELASKMVEKATSAVRDTLKSQG